MSSSVPDEPTKQELAQSDIRPTSSAARFPDDGFEIYEDAIWDSQSLKTPVRIPGRLIDINVSPDEFHYGDYGDYEEIESSHPHVVVGSIQKYCLYGLCQRITATCGVLIQPELPLSEMVNGTRVISIDQIWPISVDLYRVSSKESFVERKRLNAAINKQLRAHCTELTWFSGFLRNLTLAAQESQWTPEDLEDGRRTLIACIICGEQLDAMATALMQGESQFLPVMYPDTGKWHYKSLRHRGWCLRHITALMSMHLPSIAVANLAETTLRRHTLDHSSCSWENCLFETLDNATYKTAHTADCVGCVVADLDTEFQSQLAQIFELGRIPLVTVLDESPGGVPRTELTSISRDSLSSWGYRYVSQSPSPNQKDVRITAFSDSNSRKVEFVAISHIWADGLGAPGTNSLPSCQLRRLQKYVQSVVRPHLKENFKHFWIDSLCIPVDDRFRKQAIKDMASIYSGAGAVLVVDSTLQDVTMENLIRHPDVVLCLVLVSPWNRRLWTYQEAYCGQNIVFQFADCAVPLFEILSSCFTRHWGRQSSDIVTVKTIEEYHISSMNKVLMKGVDLYLDISFPFQVPEEERQTRMTRVLRNLSLRQTSRSMDEALCLAVLLRKDVTSLYDMDPDERMKELIRWHARVPIVFLWYRGPRYIEDGCRWIPKSFLWTPKAGIMLDELPKGHCSHDGKGLYVLTAGIRFVVVPDYEDPVAHSERPNSLPLAYVRYDESNDPRPCCVIPWDSQAAFSWTAYAGREMALLFHHYLDDLRFGGWHTQVVLVSVKEEVESPTQGNTVYVRFECPVDVMMENCLNDPDKLQGIATMNTSPTQRWCVG